MVVHLLKVQFESVVESDGMALEEVDVEYWTNARRGAGCEGTVCG